MKRIVLWIGAIAALLVLVAALVLWVLLQASREDVTGEQAVAGLTAPVTVERDADGVVTLRGDDYIDVAAALGFVHAQSRFFQMDTLRRAGAGEMAALFGEAALGFDRERRRWLMRERIGPVMASLTPEERSHLEAYARGVNAGLQALDARPPEYLLLRQTPEPWRAEDSLLVALSMFFYLTPETAAPDRMMDRLTASLPPSVVRFLTDPADAWDAPIVEESVATMPPIPGPDDFDVRAFEAPEMRPDRLFNGGLPARGSNAWAVSGELAGGGAGLVAGDMHLGLDLPNTWFRVRLVSEADTMPTLTGVSLPGTPGIVSGSNGHVAWAFTNSYGDWSTRVRLADFDGESFQGSDGRIPVESREARIRVAGGESVTMTYPWTPWGPVVTEDETAQALVWTGAMPAAVNLRFGPLYRARNVDEALTAAAGLGIPPQNILAADSAGDIGWSIAGRLPQRGDWMRPGRRLPVSSSFAGIRDWLAPADYPRVTNPENGRLWSGNGRMVGGEALEKIGGWGYPFGVRQRHIRDRLFELETFDEPAMLRLQLDDEARFLHQWVDVALAAAEHAPPSAGRRLFRREIAYWHGHAWTGSVGYRLLRAFREEVTARALGPLVQPALERFDGFSLRYLYKRERPVRQLLRQRPTHLLAPVFDDWDALLVDAMQAVIDDHDLENGALPTWGEANQLAMGHPFSGMLPWLSGQLDMPAVPLPGDRDMPRVQRPGFGASQRMVVRPGRESEGIFHMPGGQSGHFLSPWYDAGHRDWVEGRASAFLPGETTHTLTLVPAQ